LKALSKHTRRVIETLSAFLRIADALDRSRFAVVQDITARVGKSVVVLVKTAGDAELEMWAARNRTDLFEKVFNRPVQFELEQPRKRKS
ncbi:MAG TPA: hypothetical protein VHQ67_06900, partial [Nitrospiraceae bacterium]|nr:hypothetical protein [Nitrospiraceae bacterium]